MQESHCPTGIAVKKTGLKQFETNYGKQTILFIFRQLEIARVQWGPIQIRTRLRRIAGSGSGLEESKLNPSKKDFDFCTSQRTARTITFHLTLTKSGQRGVKKYFRAHEKSRTVPFTDQLYSRYSNLHAEWWSDIRPDQTDRQTDRRTDWQKNRQTRRQAGSKART